MSLNEEEKEEEQREREVDLSWYQCIGLSYSLSTPLLFDVSTEKKTCNIFQIYPGAL